MFAPNLRSNNRVYVAARPSFQFRNGVADRRGIERRTRSMPNTPRVSIIREFFS
jgi:hypothetical protein